MRQIKFLLVTIVIATLAACGTTSTVPLTGRRHTISVSDAEILSLSKTQYAKFMASAKKSTNTRNTQMVVRVGRRLANAVENYLRNNGYANEIKNFQWEFNLIQDKQATKQQNQSIGTSILGTVLNSAVGNGTGDIVNSIASTGFSLLNLKYSRKNEQEADYMGLIFAAMAGYDPQNAIPFWQRMAASSQGAPMEFMSSHPSDATRIRNIQKWIPEAMKYYQASLRRVKRNA